jgi:histidine triad (HIT) family protein
MNKACVFCKIIKKEVPASVVFEDKDVLAFKDVRPLAPVHILIIPKKHIESINDLKKSDQALIGKIIIVGKQIPEDLNISDKGYKMLFRVGHDGGQEVGHIHLHLIGGVKLYEEIRPE